MTVQRANAKYTPLDAPGPVPWHMVRSIPAIRRDPVSWLASQHRRYGQVFALPMQSPAVVAVSDPDIVHDVLVQQHKHFTKDTVQYRALARITDGGLLTSDGEEWRTARGVIQPAFHRRHLPDVVAASVEATNGFVRAWRKAGATPIEELSLRSGMQIISWSLLGAEPEGPAAAASLRLIESVLKALSVVVRHAQNPIQLPDWVPSPGGRVLRKVGHELDEACATLMTRAAHAAPHSLVALLDEAHRSGQLTSRQVRAELVTAIIAGHETVATAFTWTLGLLARDRRTQALVRSELLDVLDGQPLSVDVLKELHLTRAVVDESLRLYPPAWVISRKAQQDVTLGGLDVPAGTVLVMSPYVVHRNAELFADADEFDPQRFLGDWSSAQRRAFVPFGAGPRLCIGRDFARVELVSMLATVLSEHVVRCRPNSQMPQWKAEVTLRPDDGMHLWVRPAH